MVVRADNWTKEQDTLLVETIIKGVRDGYTQQEMFHRVAVTLGDRTSGACGFRWNSVLRKKNENRLKKARLSRIKAEDYVRSQRKSKYAPLISLISVEDIWCHVYSSGLEVKITIIPGVPTDEQLDTGEYSLLSQIPMAIN